MTKHLLCLLLAIAPVRAADTLTQQERNVAMSHLHATHKRFYDAVAGLSEAQWTFKSAPDRWSIAECAEHIAVSEDFLFGLVTEKIMKAPAAPEKKASTQGNDEAILKTVTDRTQKAQAPEPLRPSHRWATREDLLRSFALSRERTVAYVEKTQEDLRSHIAPFGPGRSADAYQVILFISGHSARHTAQIEEVKADPKYPKN